MNENSFECLNLKKQFFDLSGGEKFASLVTRFIERDQFKPNFGIKVFTVGGRQKKYRAKQRHEFWEFLIFIFQN